MQLDVPFYGNTEDNTHCFQAGIRMVLKYFYPDEEYSYEELEEISGKEPGMWTWPMAAFIWLAEKGMEVKNIEMFDYERFSSNPEEYLREIYTKEVADAQISHANMRLEAHRAAMYLRKIESIRHVPTMEEIKQHLDEGYLVECNVNSRTLNDKEGYSGHFVLVIGYDSKGFIVHDPGNPHHANRHVEYATFDRAWSYSGPIAKNLSAFRIAAAASGDAHRTQSRRKA